MNFNRYRFLYLFIIIAGTSVMFILRGPFYEAVIDISLAPPENVRKTDFSWITVNEWFNSQAYIITSHLILKEVKSNLSEKQLKDIIHVERLGAADILRIYVRSEDQPERLKRISDEIANSYLNILNKEEEQPQQPAVATEKEKIAAEEANKNNLQNILEAYKKTTEMLYAERAIIQKKIKTTDEGLRNYELELKKYEAHSKRLIELGGRISQLDREMADLKQRYDTLKMVYTDNWPSVAELKQKIAVLEKEKEGAISELTDEQKLEEQRLDIMIKIQDGQRNMAGLQNELNSTENHLARLEAEIKEVTLKAVAPQKVELPPTQTPPKKREIYGYIINPPTINFLPDLWIKLMYGGTLGSLLWFLLYLLFLRQAVDGSNKKAL